MSTPDANAVPASWAVHLESGLVLHVPPSLRSMTTYVLLEQERWFEPEMSLLPRLLEPGTQALDIGANHGVVALEIARCTGETGHVWAFEPTSAPRGRLQQSVRANGLQDRVTVVAAALAEGAGQASFAVHENSELNSRGGAGAQRETVQLLALDDYLAEHAPGVEIGFVKLDAEGDELRVLAGAKAFLAAQSPLVMFEYKHGNAVNTGLVDAWHELGFGIFRWSAELELLLPFDAASSETAFALNLFAVRPGTQQALQARGLLATAQALATEPPLAPEALSAAALKTWSAQPALQGLLPLAPATGGELYDRALHAVAAAHFDTTLRPAQRAALMTGVRDELLAAADAGASFGPAAWALLVHALLALGSQHAAVKMAARLLARWPRGSQVDVAFAPPRRADLARPRSTPVGDWLRQMLAEFVETHSAFSSYFTSPSPQRWAALLEHPDHGAEIERRFLLAHVGVGTAAPLALLSRLPDPRHTGNTPLWGGLMASMRPAPAAAAAETVAA